MKSQVMIVLWPCDPNKRKEVVVDSEAFGVWHVVRRNVVSKAAGGLDQYENPYNPTRLTAYNVYHANGYVTRAYKTKAQAILVAIAAEKMFNGTVEIGEDGYPLFEKIGKERANALFSLFANAEGAQYA